MKRRIIVLSVLVLSLFALTQPGSVAGSSSVDCYDCFMNAQACYQQCDIEYAGYPARLRECYDWCFWQEETCYWTC